MLNRVRAHLRLALCVMSFVLAACGNDSEPATATSARSYPATPRTLFGGDRPVTLQVPTTYSSARPTPLLLILHGYGADGLVQEQYLRLGGLVESAGVLVLAPNGTINKSGIRFWNATDACCGFGARVDDLAYLRGLIADVSQDYNVDRRRVFLLGHSNGGFMSHRMACEAASEIAAIVSLAGATYADASKCQPAVPVSVLDIHGDADDTILYDGGTTLGSYPGELETVAHWQVYDRCRAGLVTDPTVLDLDRNVAGDETTVQKFEGCAAGTDVELWTIHGGGHIPTVTRDFPNIVWGWLNAHPKQ